MLPLFISFGLLAVSLLRVLRKQRQKRALTHSSPSSVATDQTQVNYDVFLSFRGSDTRDNFTSHLHAALEREKIQTFLDDNLDRGQEIVPSVVKAIQESKMAVLVFSRNYADSPWCLDELVEILECKDKARMEVLPVFYRVNPSNVQDQTGEFGEGFKRLRKAYHSDKLDEWSDALKKASEISGLDWTKYRSDHMLTKEVVEWVLERLRRQSLSGALTIDRKLVGMELHLERILPLLQTREANVLFLGIWGMGGIGKSTCAVELLYHINSDFESSYFLPSVREESRKRMFVCLRNEVLGKILGEEIADKTPGRLPDHIINRLRRMKVLIIVDDISSVEQFTSIVGDRDLYGPGSRIIITTRDKQVLNGCEANGSYKVEGLNDDRALQLFSLHAFQQSSPEESYLELSKMVIDYAKGVPLALKVLGALLCKKEPKEWNSKIEKLRTMPEQRVMDALQISYDELDQVEKNIFLDIACFFKGEDRDLVKDILDGCEFFATSGLGCLQDKCLIDIVDDKLQMHDLVQEMGWDMVRKKPDCQKCRFWKAKDVERLLEGNTGTELIEGIILNMYEIKKMVDIAPQAFSRMNKLRILKVYFLYEERTLESSAPCLPSSLRYIYFVYYPWKSLPPDFSPSNLIVLCIYDSPIECLWSEDKVLPQLKHIDLANLHYLESLPDMSSAVKLQTLQLSCCPLLEEFPKVPANIKELYLDDIGFEEWPPSIQSLDKLELLIVESCSELRRIPDISSVVNLQTLKLSYYPLLKEFPKVPANIKELYLDNIGFEEWPPSIQSLDKLELLTIEECFELRRIPGISSAINLQTLKLSDCPLLKEFPEVPANIKELYLDNIGFEEWPSSIQSLDKLQLLEIRDCTELRKLPGTLHLDSLEKIFLSNCINLQKIPEIVGKNLKVLNLFGSEIDKISVRHLTSLCVLNLSFTNVKELLIPIGQLTSLVELNLRGCRSLCRLSSNSCELKSLKRLVMSSCPNLRELASDLHGLESLTELDLSGSGIQELPESIGHLSALKRLYMGGSCVEQISPSIERLSLLEELDLSGCTRLQYLPKLPSLVSFVDSTGCSSLKNVDCAAIDAIEKSWQNAHGYRFIFFNCTQLEKSARDNITQLLRINQGIETTLRKFCATSEYPGHPKFRVCLPENRIPDWFQDQKEGSRIHTSFSRCQYKMSSIGLALSVLVEPPIDNIGYTVNLLNITCKCDLTNHKGDVTHLSFHFNPPKAIPVQSCFECDHVFIWLVRDLHTSTKSDETYLLKVSFEFSAPFLVSGRQWGGKVKKCGARVVNFASEDQNYPSSSKRSSSHDPSHLSASTSSSKRQK